MERTSFVRGQPMVLCKVLLLSLLLAARLAAASRQLAVYSEQELLHALSIPNVSTITIQRSLKLSAAVWPRPVEVARNLTITGHQHSSEHGSSWRQLDLGFLERRLALAPGTTLTLKHLTLLNSYTEWVPGFSFIEYAPGATVRLVNSMRVLPACPADMEWLRQVVQDHSLPPAYQPPPPEELAAAAADTGLAALPQQFSNSLFALNSTQCAQLLRQRWRGAMEPRTPLPAGFLVDRLAYEVPRQPDRRRAHAFSGVDEAFGSVYACQTVLAPRCVQRQGFPACFTAAAKAAAARHRWRTRLPDLLGLVATLAAILLPAVWWWKQQQQQQSSKVAAAARPGAQACLLDLPMMDDWRAARDITVPSPPQGSTLLHAPAATKGADSSTAAQLVADSAGLFVLARPAAGCDAGTEEDATLSSPGTDGSLTGLVCGPMIGVGSQGRVYKSKWQGRTVAVKVMEIRRSQDFKAVRHELAINQLLQHPNVVQSLASHLQLLEEPLSSPAHPWSGMDSYNSSGAGSSGGSGSGSGVPGPAWTQVLLVLEYCDGGSLQDAVMHGLLRRPGGADPRRRSLDSRSSACNNMLSVLRIAKDVAAGMAHIHQRCVTHGDLCSKNILLCSTPDVPPPLSVRAKCADFGMSRLLPEARTHLSTLTHGTLTHMAPELLLNHQLRPTADVYSFGILLWELVHLGLAVPPGSAAAAAAAAGLGLLCAVGSPGSGSSPKQTGSPGSGSSLAGSSDSLPASAATERSTEPAAVQRFTHAFQHLGPAPSPWAVMQHVINGGRPVFAAPAVPGPYIALAQRCWHPQPDQRPTFAEIVVLLECELLGPAANDLVGSF